MTIFLIILGFVILFLSGIIWNEVKYKKNINIIEKWIGNSLVRYELQDYEWNDVNNYNKLCKKVHWAISSAGSWKVVDTTHKRKVAKVQKEVDELLIKYVSIDKKIFQLKYKYKQRMKNLELKN